MRIRTLLGSAALALAIVPQAFGDAIIKIPLSETTSYDVEFDGLTFSTVDDGNAATLGEQDSRVDFVGFLSYLSDIVTAPLGSFTISGVQANGTPTNGLVTVQETIGGTFSLYDEVNTLLLSGSLAQGAITGSASTTGSFFNTTIATYTGGSLLAYVAPTPAGISFALAGILSEGDIVGLVINEDALSPFVADASGVLTGTEVPEPLTAALLLSGVVGAFGVKKKVGAIAA